MARTMSIPPPFPVLELERQYRTARDPVEHSHWQIVWLLARGDPAAAAPDVTSYTVKWVREIARRYRVEGQTRLGDRRYTNRGRPPCWMLRSRRSCGRYWAAQRRTVSCGPVTRWQAG